MSEIYGLASLLVAITILDLMSGQRYECLMTLVTCEPGKIQGSGF